eukprot:9713706-Lingulodinium_polyedra.AAC.1
MHLHHALGCGSRLRVVRRPPRHQQTLAMVGNRECSLLAHALLVVADAAQQPDDHPGDGHGGGGLSDGPCSCTFGGGR